MSFSAPLNLQTMELLLLGNRHHLFNICSHLSCYTSYLHLLSKMRQEKEAKGIQIGTEETKLALFSNNLIFYIEIKKEKLKRNKLQELINT